MAWFRRRALPAEQRPPLARDERVVAWTRTDAGVLAATNLGLWLPADPPGRLVGRHLGRASGAAFVVGRHLGRASGAAFVVGRHLGRTSGAAFVGWHEIHKAVWTGRELAVTAAREVASRAGFTVVEDLPTVGFTLSEPGELPHQVRVRVTRSVGYSAHHPLPGGGGFRVAARRIPGLDGLRWTVRYDPGVNRDDPIVAEVTAEVVDHAQA
jgi:hypothetical protein